MRNKFKKLFIKEIIVEKEIVKEEIITHIKKIELDIVVPKYSRDLMFWDKEQAKEFYLFLCSKYISYIKEWKKEIADEIQKIISDLVILWEWIQYYGLTKEYSVKG